MPASGGPGQQATPSAIRAMPVTRATVIAMPVSSEPNSTRPTSDGTISNATPVTFPEDETFDIGQDTRTGVALVEYRYDTPFKFTGKINKLTFKLAPPKP